MDPESENNQILDALPKLDHMINGAIGNDKIKEIDKELEKFVNPEKVDIKDNLDNESFVLKLLLSYIKKGFGCSVQEMLSVIVEKSDREKNGSDEQSKENNFELLQKIAQSKLPNNDLNAASSSQLHRNLFAISKIKKSSSSEKAAASFRPKSVFKNSTKISKISSKKTRGSALCSNSSMNHAESPADDDPEWVIVVSGNKFLCRGSNIYLKSRGKFEKFTSVQIPPKDIVEILLKNLCEWDATANTDMNKMKCPDPYCNFFFLENETDTIREHFLVNHLGKRFKCPVVECSRMIQWRSLLKKHLRTHRSIYTKMDCKKLSKSDLSYYDKSKDYVVKVEVVEFLE